MFLNTVAHIYQSFGNVCVSRTKLNISAGVRKLCNWFIYLFYLFGISDNPKYTELSVNPFLFPGNALHPYFKSLMGFCCCCCFKWINLLIKNKRWKWFPEHFIAWSKKNAFNKLWQVVITCTAYPLTIKTTNPF